MHPPGRVLALAQSVARDDGSANLIDESNNHTWSNG